MSKDHRTQVLAFTGSKGGTGVSTIVSNLGYLLAKTFKKKVLLIDAASYTNHISALINNNNITTLASLCSASEMTEEAVLSKMKSSVNDNLSVISLINGLEDIESINEDSINMLLEISKKEYDFIFIDLKFNLLEKYNRMFFNLADYVNIVTTYDVLAMRDTKADFNLLKDFGLSENMIRVVLNRADCEIGDLDPDLVIAKFGHQVFCALPNDWKNLIEASNQKLPIIDYSSVSPLSKELKIFGDYLIKTQLTV